MRGSVFIVMKKSKGFISIEVLLIFLACSYITSSLLFSSFERRKGIDRAYKIEERKINKHIEEEAFLKEIIEKNILTATNYKNLNFSKGNVKAFYDEEEELLSLVRKDKVSGVSYKTYYSIDISLEEEEIFLEKVRII